MRVIPRIILSLLFLLQPHQVFSADQEQELVISVLPFEVSEEGEYAFLNRSIDQMLLARLSRYQDLKILAITLDDERIKALQQEQQAGDLGEAAAKLRGQWLVEPSMYSLKGGMQLNLSLIPLQGGRAISFTEKIDNQDQIMAAVSSLAEDIYKTVSELDSEDNLARIEKKDDEALSGFATPHPERDYKRGIYGGASIIAGDQGGASFESRGVRKSGVLPMQVEALVAGDLNNDGRKDLIVSSRSKIRIFTYDDLNFQLVASYDFSPAMKIHALNIGDLDSDGTKELYISANEGRYASSAILGWNGSKSLQSVSQGLRWYIRPLRIPGKGEVLIGQQTSFRQDQDFLSPGVFELSRNPDTGRLKKGNKMLLPEGTNLFDFIHADLDGDGLAETVVIDKDQKLLVYDSALNLIWVSSANYGGSKRYFGPHWQKTDSVDSSGLSQSQQDNRRLIFIPGRLDVKDITGNGLPEVVLSTNEVSISKYLKNTRTYDGGAVACLGWYGQGLVEFWRTSQISGYVADYFFDDSADEIDTRGRITNRLYVAQIPASSIIDKILPQRVSKLLAYEMVVTKVAEKPASP
ncbi:MAG: hypothetical protein HKP44_01825 [Desulfofustis sp.]|nr:hypothetical protein [Desulfofustis sp.]